MGGLPRAAARAVKGERVRPATTKDVPSISRIESQVFSDPWPATSFQSLLSATHVFFGCVDGSEAGTHGLSEDDIAGYVVAGFAGGEGEILNLAVSELARGRGVGKRLL